MLNTSKGNMYPWVTHTWNAIKGKCSHDCEYCYMKKFKLNSIRFDYGELRIDLGKDNFIFVGSSTDMFASDIPDDWIIKILEYCGNFKTNKYLFQTKNPSRFHDFLDKFPDNTIFGTTIESNISHGETKAPLPNERMSSMMRINAPKMISIEPIMDFEYKIFSAMIRNIMPEFVSVGADSKGHGLPEPSKDKTLQLIGTLKTFTEVKIKDNLYRLIK